VPESQSSDDRRSTRAAAARSADHAAIDRLAAELLPALIAKLGATGLGEIEVREGGWRVRLRRPGEPTGHAPANPSPSRSRADRAERSADRAPRPVTGAADSHATPAAPRAVATSPAVGIYRPRTDLTVGDRVRAGDRLGAVDMLGVAQEVVAPFDGIVGGSLVESGDAVEYGQELLHVEPSVNSPSSTNGTS
jgi:acetyl-CoA carboxylase biotin carboxyl carrier protein